MSTETASRWSRLPLEIRQRIVSFALEDQLMEDGFKAILDADLFEDFPHYAVDFCMAAARTFDLRELLQRLERVEPLIPCFAFVINARRIAGGDDRLSCTLPHYRWNGAEDMEQVVKKFICTLESLIVRFPLRPQVPVHDDTDKAQAQRKANAARC